MRLQDIYNLDVRDFSQGEVGVGGPKTDEGPVVRTNARLTGEDCLFLGKHSFNSGALSRSIEWFEEAWYLSGAERNRTLNQDHAKKFLDKAAKVVSGADSVQIIN